jgi:membrane peptidoglycan carboxypeptidase
VSNPSSPQGYWQEPGRDGRRATRSGQSRDDRYDRGSYGNQAGYGGSASGRSSRSNGYGRPSGNGSASEYDRGSRNGEGSRRSGGYPRRNGSGSGTGYGGYSGSGRSGGYRPRDGHGRSDFGRDDGYDGGYDGGRRPGGSRGRSSEVGSDLRSRLGLDNGRGYRDDEYADADDDYGEIRGYRRGYRDTGGWRGATTGLRERLTGRFGDGSTRGGARGYAGDGGSGDGGDHKTRVRRKGDWWRHWTWKKAVWVTLGTGAGLVVLGIMGIIYAYEKTPIPTDVSAVALQQSSTVYFSDGKTVVGTFSENGVDRQLLASNQIPNVMKQAMVAAEDRHFYTEGGISVTGILRATYVDLRGGDYAQGGSTLTQQFVRNYFASIGTEQTLSRKFKEIFVSIKLAHQETKDWILTQYLNLVPFGDNAYGVGAASEIYFGEPALKLTVAQAAMLAALPNAPSTFSPEPSAGAGYTALVNRWHYVLGNMVRDGVLTQAQANAQKFPTVDENNLLASSWTGYKGYIMAAVESELENTYGYTQQQIDSDGLKIVTTINVNLMNGLYNAVDQNLTQMKDDGTALPWYAHVGAVLENSSTGAIEAFYGGPDYSLTPAQCEKVFCQLNMAMQNREQVGSSFKPYVLATAVDQGMNVQTSTINAIEPMCVPPDTMPNTLSTVSTNCPPSWFPIDIPGENMGAISVPVAAAQSSDPGFEDLEHRVGTQATIAMAKSFGVNTASASQGGSNLDNYVGDVGMALGIASLTVEEQANTFATLANYGMYDAPHVIQQITKSDGTQVPLKLDRHQVLSDQDAADVDYALQYDTINGTAAVNGPLNPFRPTIAKTGTTDDAESAFFIGAFPTQYSLAVGIFTNQQNGQAGESLNILPSINGQLGGYGGSWPTMIWHTFMQNQFANLPVIQLQPPNETGMVTWNQVAQNAPPKKKSSNTGQNGCPPGDVRELGQCVNPSSPPSSSPPSSSPPSSSPPTSPPPTGGGGGPGGGGGGGGGGRGGAAARGP